MNLNTEMWGISGIFDPVRPRLARWEHKRPQGAAGHYMKWGNIRGTFYTLFKIRTQGIEIVPVFGKFELVHSKLKVKLMRSNLLPCPQPPQCDSCW